MQVAKRLKLAKSAIDRSALYLLTSGQVSESVWTAVAGRAEAGEKITCALVEEAKAKCAQEARKARSADAGGDPFADAKHAPIEVSARVVSSLPLDTILDEDRFLKELNYVAHCLRRTVEAPETIEGWTRGKDICDALQVLNALIRHAGPSFKKTSKALPAAESAPAAA